MLIHLCEDCIERRPVSVVKGPGSLIGVGIELSGRGVTKAKGLVAPQVRLIPTSKPIGLMRVVFRAANKVLDPLVA